MGKTRNTGFSNNAIQYNSGSIAFTSGSTTRMFISASGFVGMGTTSPSYSLDVVSPTGFVVSKFKSSYSASAFIGTDNAQAWFGQGSAATNGGNTAYFVNDSTGTALIQTSGSVKVTINASGSVGIGTATPSYKLDVSGSTRIGAGVAQVAPSSTDILSTAHVILGGMGDNYLTVGQYPAGQSFAAWIQSSYLNPTTAKYNLVLNPLGGNIGIGTATPTTKLEIADANGIPLRFGDIAAAPTNQTAGYIGLSTSAYGGNNGDLVLVPRTSAPSRILLISGSVGIGTTSTSTEANLFLGTNGTAEGGQLVLQSGTSYASASHIDNYQNQLRIMSGTNVGSNTVRMSVDMTSGNVLIGTSTDIGYRLYVVGGGGQGGGWLQQDSAPPLYLNRTGNDGGEVIFLKAGTQVGSINTNSYSLPSDANFKKNIENLNLGLNLISKLRAISYNHKIDDEGSALSTGFIAQELEQALTELGVEQNKYHILQHIPNSKEGESQYWLDYQKMIPILTKAIQELKAENDALKTRIETLENK